jgi:quercetin dioxygenase-like cupin family protein
MTIITDRPDRRPDSLPPRSWSAAVSLALELAGDDRVRCRPVRTVARSWELLIATDELEAWVIDWPSRGAISLHDHGKSSGAVVVTTGELTESRVRVRADGQLDLETNRLSTGGVVEIGPGVIHDVQNIGTGRATSVHVYSPRLTSMTYFSIARSSLVADRTVSYATTSSER